MLLLKRTQIRCSPSSRLVLGLNVRIPFAAFQQAKSVNNTMMHLRKVCNHPYLFPEVEVWLVDTGLELVFFAVWLYDEQGGRFLLLMLCISTARR